MSSAPVPVPVFVFGLGAMAAGLAVAAVLFLLQELATRGDRRRFRPPGRIVATSAGGLHVRLDGVGEPTIVLESALAGSSLSWSGIAPRLAQLSRVLVYDRAGFGFSTESRSPRTIEAIVSELGELLDRLERSGVDADTGTPTASSPARYVLVGHSFGGWVARLFTAENPDRVAGLVLVDDPDPLEWAEPTPERRRRIVRGARLARRFALGARFGLARMALRFGSAGRLPSLFAAGATDRERDRVVSLLHRVPVEVRPTLRSFWSRPESYRALASLIEHVPGSARRVADVGASKCFAAIPIVALTAADPSPERVRERELLVSQSAHGRHVVATQSGHWIPLEEPELVVAAVKEVLERIRGLPQDKDSHGGTETQRSEANEVL